MPSRTRKNHLNVHLTDEEYDAIYKAATKRSMPLAGYARAAIKAKLMADETFYYVRLPDGTIYPDAGEPGFEDLGNARRAAAKREGEVVRHTMELIHAGEK